MKKTIETITSELNDYVHINPKANNVKLPNKLQRVTVGALPCTIQRQLKRITEVLKEEYEGQQEKIWFYLQYDEVTIIRTGHLDVYPKFTTEYYHERGGYIELERPKLFKGCLVHPSYKYGEDIERIPKIAESILYRLYNGEKSI